MYEEKARYEAELRTASVPVHEVTLTGELARLHNLVRKQDAMLHELMERVQRLERQTSLENMDQQLGVAFASRNG